jgi:hypothetical protein
MNSFEQDIIKIVVSNFNKYGTTYDTKEASRKEIKEKFQLESNYDFGSIIGMNVNSIVKVYIYSKEPNISWQLIEFNLAHELRDYKLNKLLHDG